MECEYGKLNELPWEKKDGMRDWCKSWSQSYRELKEDHCIIITLNFLEESSK